jgi:hypothetical protein
VGDGLKLCWNCGYKVMLGEDVGGHRDMGIPNWGFSNCCSVVGVGNVLLGWCACGVCGDRDDLCCIVGL